MTITIHRRNGQTYEATIDATHIRTPYGDAPLAWPTSNNPAVNTCNKVVGRLRDTLHKAGLADTEIDAGVYLWGEDNRRRGWTCITDPRDIAVIIPLVNAATAASAAATRAREAQEARTVEIVVATRGWGDYAPVVWRGDITRPADEIVAECVAAVKSASDVDGNPTVDEITGLVNAARAKHAAKHNAAAKEEARVAACLARAAQTGERVEIKRYTDECDDPREECSLDIVTVWAIPDGTIRETRNHTW